MTRTAPNRPATAPIPAKKMPGMGWVEWMVLLQTLLPAMMFIPGATSVRFVLRILGTVSPLIAWAAVFLSGRAMRGGNRFLPASILAFCAGFLVLSIAHPDTNSLASGTAEAFLNIAIFSPVFWVPALITDSRQVRRLVLIVLMCNASSALMGIAQVYRPQTFNPPYMPMLDRAELGEEDMRVTTDDGRKFVRPPGLTDTPGGAAIPGMLTCLTGLAVALQPMALWKRALSMGLSVAGLAVIFFSQVRIALLVMFVAMAVWVTLLVLRRDTRRLITLSFLATFLGVAGVGWVWRTGGQAVMGRFLALTEQKADQAYYSHRGRFVEYALTVELPEFPLGAGLGRFGMMNSYFGDPLAPFSRAKLYAETQIEAWVLDGGAILLLSSVTAIALAIYQSGRVAVRPPDPDLGYWASVVVALEVTTAMMALGGMPFLSPNGLQFWVLAAALYGASTVARNEAPRRSAPARRPPDGLTEAVLPAATPKRPGG